jgi:hypothetical protein
VLTLPNGDLLLSAEGDPSAPGFSMGGSATVRSNALILGKRDRWRQHTTPRSGAEGIAVLIRWVEAGASKADNGEGARAILVDPAQRSIEMVSIQRSLKAIQHLLGGEIVLAFHAPGGDRVYAAAGAQGLRWRKDDAVFVGRSVVVGALEGRLEDAAASLEKLRKDVRFADEGSKRWHRCRDTGALCQASP